MAVRRERMVSAPHCRRCTKLDTEAAPFQGSKERCAITGSHSAPSGRNRLGHCVVPPRRPLGQWSGNTTAGGRKRRRDSGSEGGANYNGEGRQATVVAREHGHDRDLARGDKDARGKENARRAQLTAPSDTGADDAGTENATPSRSRTAPSGQFGNTKCNEGREAKQLKSGTPYERLRG